MHDNIIMSIQLEILIMFIHEIDAKQTQTFDNIIKQTVEKILLICLLEKYLHTHNQPAARRHNENCLLNNYDFSRIFFMKLKTI